MDTKVLMAHPFGLSAAVAGLLILGGCEDFDFGDRSRYKEDFHQSAPLSPGGRIDLDTVNGAVDVTGWEKDEVEINGTKQASEKYLLDGTRVQVTPSAGIVRIHTVLPSSGRRGGVGVRYSLRVPHRVLLDRIVTSNGSIRIENIQGGLNLRSSNGEIRIVHAKGNLDAQTSNGRCELQDFEGNGTVRSSNGRIEGTILHGSVDAFTSNGSLALSYEDPDTSRPLRLDTSNSAIEVSISGPKTPDVRATTSNAGITLKLPANAQARLRAHTSNASITSEFGPGESSTSERSRTHLEQTIGNSGAFIDLGTSNGPVKIAKR